MNSFSGFDDTIAAIATAPGTGAIGIIRISGKNTFDIAAKIFKGKHPAQQPSHTAHFGRIISPEDGSVVDEVLLTVFKNPHSFTGEDTVEISGHGSPYILQKILEAAIAAGARMAAPGEFTQRAFLNGKLDLTQAEAVADLIAAGSRAQHQAALQQLRGGFSKELSALREKMIEFASLMELELDFSDEDVEFADRTAFRNLITELKTRTQKLLDSFRLGNVIKKGVRVAIIGKPNAGKSTLLNALLNEERAIVSDIAGTTRDTIEETLNIHGILFRLIDTAGIRTHSTDVIEKQGIERSKANAEKADIIIHLIDLTDKDPEAPSIAEWLLPHAHKTLTVYNKLRPWRESHPGQSLEGRIAIDAKSGEGISELKDLLYQQTVGGNVQTDDVIVTNARHYASLLKIMESLNAIEKGMDRHLPGDLLTIDIRRALHYMGEITGQVEVDRDILGTIFGRFCIGK